MKEARGGVGDRATENPRDPGPHEVSLTVELSFRYGGGQGSERGWLTISQSQTGCREGDSEMKGKGHGQQEDKHMQKGLDMFATGSNTGRITSASCEARGARIGAGLGVFGRPGVQRRQALLGTPLDTFPGMQREEGPL